MALTVEAAELMELFQWSTGGESRDARSDPAILAAAQQEIADVLIYVLRLADVLGIDLDRAVRTKILLNADKYPTELSKGNATKYDRRPR
jgi:NTP pyrophosphatase (non-canonical NTP hydrolase)